MDDFQTPYGGIPEVSALLFGDSWKLQPHCIQPSEIRVSVIQKNFFVNKNFYIR